MDRLTDDNINNSLIPTTWAQIADELPETVQTMLANALRGESTSLSDLPVWYVLAKASGASGIPLRELYNDPVVRQHAVAVLACDMSFTGQMQQLAQERSQQE